MIEVKFISSVCSEESVRINRDKKGKSLLESFDNYVALDLETTGLDPRYDNIIEIGLVKVVNGEIVNQFSSLVNPGYEIDDFIMELTGITNEMLQDAPTISEVIQAAVNFASNEIIVAHNANFDLNFLYDNSMSLLGIPLSNNFVDTMRLSRRLFPEHKHHRLRDLMERFEVGKKVVHRAIDDAVMAVNCYEYMKKYMREHGIAPAGLYPVHAVGLKAKDITTVNTDFDTDSPIYNSTFVFTGKLDRMVRPDAMQLVADLGGTCADSVSKKVDYLVLGNNDYCTTIKDGKSSKMKKAEALKLSGVPIEIITEDIFYNMVGI